MPPRFTKEFVVRFAQVPHGSFRKPELQTLGELEKVDFDFVYYEEVSPFAIISAESCDAVRKLIRRSILTKCAYELWGVGNTYGELRADVTKRIGMYGYREKYRHCSFRFDMDCYGTARSEKEKVEIIETFQFTGLEGPIRMKNPDETFAIMEDYKSNSTKFTTKLGTQEAGEQSAEAPLNDIAAAQASFEHAAAASATRTENENNEVPILIRVLFGRLIGTASRNKIMHYDLKKRHYIGTTSMDAELSLITANFAHAAFGKLICDPFVGTGSFLVACAHFGAVTMGSDLDGRTMRGKKNRNLKSNFDQYKFPERLLDVFAADITNTPIRASTGMFDAIVCDPPYGVREGLKVLGHRDPTKGHEPVFIEGVAAHKRPDYVPPRKAYSFEALLQDIMNFAACHLVKNGRLCMWLPVASEEDYTPLGLPSHPQLERRYTSVQVFGQWSRRLLTYVKIHDSNTSNNGTPPNPDVSTSGSDSKSTAILYADDLNPFRRKFFTKNRNKDGASINDLPKSDSDTENASSR